MQLVFFGETVDVTGQSVTAQHFVLSRAVPVPLLIVFSLTSAIGCANRRIFIGSVARLAL